MTQMQCKLLCQLVRKLRLLYSLYFLLCYFVLFILYGWLALYYVPVSEHQCTPFNSSSDNIDDRLSGKNSVCVYKNLVVSSGQLFYVYADTVPVLPYIRISVDSTQEGWWSLFKPAPLSCFSWRAILAALSTPYPRSALLWTPLNSENYYHSLWEDLLPIARRLQLSLGEEGGIGAGSDRAKVMLLATRDMSPHIDWKLIFYNEPITLSPALATRFLPKVVAGSQCVCNHRMHCQHQWEDGFLSSMRDVLLARLSLTVEDVPVESVLSPSAGTSDRNGNRSLNVLVIQRLGARRRFVGLEDALSNLTGRAGINLAVHSLEGMSNREQATLYLRADIVLAFHGAQMGNLLYLKKGGVYVDFRPSVFTTQDQPLVEWIIAASADLHIHSVYCGLPSNRTIFNWANIETLALWKNFSTAEQQEFKETRICPPWAARVCAVQLFFANGDFEVASGDFEAAISVARAVLQGEVLPRSGICQTK